MLNIKMNFYEKYNVDINRLSRDYLKYPLNVIRYGLHCSEKPTKEDIVYLYIELNISQKDICSFFNIGVTTFTRWKCGYSIKKQQNQIVKNRVATCQEQYSVTNTTKLLHVRQKMKASCLDKYGVEYPTQLTSTKDKSKQTKKLKYGNENYNNIQKIQETNLKKYGVKCTLHSKKTEEYFKEKCGTIIPTKSEIIKEKTKATIIKNKRLNPNYQSEVTNKINKTKKIHRSFNSSKDELIILNKIKEKYFNVKYQYTSKKYPFACDFYIPELDLYIDYNGHWTHGNKPYDANDIDCVDLVNNWRNKNTKYYNMAIYVYTDLDVRKRQISKKNKINRIEFFNLKEFELWNQGV